MPGEVRDVRVMDVMYLECQRFDSIGGKQVINYLSTGWAIYWC